MAIKYRSKFEEEIAEKLRGSRAKYEKLIIPFYKIHTYKPDWGLPNGVIIEGKRRFTSYDRAKHLLIMEQQPSLDIRFVFKYDNKLHKTSKTRYSEWCKRHDFKYSFTEVPKEWIREKKKSITVSDVEVGLKKD